MSTHHNNSTDAPKVEAAPGLSTVHSDPTATAAAILAATEALQERMSVPSPVVPDAQQAAGLDAVSRPPFAQPK